MSKEFFRAVGPRSAGETVPRLHYEDGRMMVDPQEILDFATDFYRRLYSAKVELHDTRESRDQVLAHFPRLVTPEMRLCLDAPFSCEELAEALRELSTRKCTCGDGLSPAFYRHFWEVVGGHLTEAFAAIWSGGEMPHDLCRGLICLIPKGGDRTLISQW